MLLDPQGEPKRPRPRILGKAVSFLVHAAVLGWVAGGPPPAPRPRPLTAYEQFIKPQEKKLVWYHFREKLPESAPRKPKSGGARTRAKQSIVAEGPRKGEQMIWQPVPQIDVTQELPSPNIVALHVPIPPPPDRPVKLFAPPRAALEEAIPDLLAPPPPVGTTPAEQSSPLDAGLRDPLSNRPQFIPPQPAPRAETQVPEPGVAVAANTPAPAVGPNVRDPLNNRPQFIPPKPAPRTQTQVPEPGVAVAANTPAPAVGPNVRDPLSNRPKLILPKPAPRAQTQVPAPAPGTAVAANTPVPAVGPNVRDPLSNRPQFIPPKPAPRAQTQVPAPAPGTAVAANTPAPAVGPNVRDPLSNRPQFIPPKPAPRAQTQVPAPAPGTAVAANTPAPAVGPNVRDPLSNRPQFIPPGAAGPNGRDPLGSGSRVEPLPPLLEEAPELAGAAAQSDVSAAIVGLRPAPRLEAPLPEGGRAAEFSAGPTLSVTPGAEPSGATLSVPGLTVSDGILRPKPEAPAGPVLLARAVPTSQANLAAAVRMTPPMPPPIIMQGDTAALRVATAPDARLEGRAVYSLTIQMPNVTSYFGSWLVWFAERDKHDGAGLQPPAPSRKVDPRYVASAVEDRVEGKVQLSAVIRRDGTVDSIAVLRSLDPRLDFAASEALSKWIFQPALRNGVPVEVDALVEVPFRLAPLELRYK